MAVLLKETVGEDVLDPVNLHRDIRGRKAGNFRDGRVVNLFQKREHDLAIQWFQLANELRELRQSALLVDVGSLLFRKRSLFDAFQSDVASVVAALAIDVGNGGIV